MRQIQGGWRMEARRDGAARFILKSPTGEQIYIDFSPTDLGDLRAALEAMTALEATPAEPAKPETESIPSHGRQRRAKA
jgi:hypothetical protein